MAAHHDTAIAHDEHHESMTKRTIWNVFWILSAITAVEFFIALYALPHGWFGEHGHHIANFVYIALTVAKATYIVAYFMHLKFEKMSLILMMIVPSILLVYFIALLIIEGNHLLTSMNNF